MSCLSWCEDMHTTLYCPGITSDKSRDEENKANTSSRPLSLLAKVGARRVRNFCYMSSTTRKTQSETTLNRWKEETHAMLTKISKYQTYDAQTVLSGFGPNTCERFWWLLIRQNPKVFTTLVSSVKRGHKISPVMSAGFART